MKTKNKNPPSRRERGENLRDATKNFLTILNSSL